MVMVVTLVTVAGVFYLLFAWRKRRMKVPGDLVVMTKRTEQMGYEAFKKGHVNPYQGVIPMSDPARRKIFDEHRQAFEKGWTRAEREAKEDKPPTPHPSRSRDVLKLVRTK